MAKANKIEYGFLRAAVGASLVSTEKATVLTKQVYMETLERVYPSSEGWKVVQRETLFDGTNYVHIYHTEREVSE